MYAGCVGGAIDMDDYLAIIQKEDFKNITVQKQKAIALPDEVLQKYVKTDEIAAFHQEDNGIFSVTVYGKKPE